MNEKTKEALELSIAKWVAIVKGVGKDHGSNNCALCDLYIKNNCFGCPVEIRTGTMFCSKTPYDDWIKHHTKVHDNNFFYAWHAEIICDTCLYFAEQELVFLKSLREEE